MTVTSQEAAQPRLVKHVERRSVSELAGAIIGPPALLALLARMLFREGYDEHVAGHISYVQPDGTLLVTPYGRAWDEVRASDVLRIDSTGAVIEGSLQALTPAISLHLATYRHRPSAKVVVHHHPHYATIWAIRREIPPAYDQLSSLIREDRIAVAEEFVGPVDGWDAATKSAEAVTSSDCALLANHGVIVVANSIEEAHFRAVCLEWRARQAWHVAAVGGGATMPTNQAKMLADKFDRGDGGTIPYLFEAMARRELRCDPGVLD